VRFAVCGNCQVDGFARSLRVLVPNCEVSEFVDPEPGSVDPRDYDLLFVQPRFAKRLGDQSSASQIRRIPIVLFTGFHPDCFYLSCHGKLVPSPFASYHSSLVAACYVLGVPSQDVPEMVNGETFEKIGFFAEFDRAKSFMIANAKTLNLDLSEVFESWVSRKQPFMYTINHPKIGVMYDLCRLVLARDGVPAPDQGAVPADRLVAGNNWPVYPPVAKRLGIPEQPLFKYAASYAKKLGDGRPGIYLSEFIEGCYQTFGTIDRDEIEAAPRVAQVLASLR
jgi:Polysaccharide biosynthesis enzyme WcbI